MSCYDMQSSDREVYTFLTCCIVINSKGVGVAPVVNAWHESEAIYRHVNPSCSACTSFTSNHFAECPHYYD
jgi:hypothetical protein